MLEFDFVEADDSGSGLIPFEIDPGSLPCRPIPAPIPVAECTSPEPPAPDPDASPFDLLFF